MGLALLSALCGSLLASLGMAVLLLALAVLRGEMANSTVSGFFDFPTFLGVMSLTFTVPGALLLGVPIMHWRQRVASFDSWREVSVVSAIGAVLGAAVMTLLTSHPFGTSLGAYYGAVTAFVVVKLVSKIQQTLAY